MRSIDRFCNAFPWMDTSVMTTATQIDAAALAETAQLLPALPPTTTRIMQLVEDPFFDIGELTRLIELDPALTGRVLRLANSAASGSLRTMNHVRDAAVFLGAGTVLALAVSACTRPNAKCDLSAFGLTKRTYWQHCLGCVAAAEELMSEKVGDFGSGFVTAALLHDFGKQILAEHLTPSHLEAFRQFRDECPGRAGIEAEREILGVDHALAGGLVAQHWQLPADIVHAIEHHHDPSDWDQILSHGVVLANEVSKELEGSNHFCHAGSEHLANSMLALDLSDSRLQSVVRAARKRLSCLLTLFA